MRKLKKRSSNFRNNRRCTSADGVALLACSRFEGEREIAGRLPSSLVDLLL